MNQGHKRRIAALALTATAAIGGSLATAAPAGAVSQVGGIGCHTNGVTVYEDIGYTALGCFAGTAGTVRTSLPGSGSVSSVVNHGYTQYYTRTNAADVTGFEANSVHYRYDDTDSQTFAVTILN